VATHLSKHSVSNCLRSVALRSLRRKPGKGWSDFRNGQKLLDIKENRRYEGAGFKSWAAYCKAGRIDYGKSQADRYIQASELRPKLPQISGTFTHFQMLELCKCKTEQDAKRVAKKSIALAKRTGERVTAKLIAQVRDGDGED
jgi:hypothetical protein